MKLAFLGPEGSYSHVAAQLFLKTESGRAHRITDWDECVPFRNFAEVFAAVENERVDAGVIPIENSLQGGVLQNMDLLQAYENIYAMKEAVLHIDHRLVYKEGTALSEIGRVYSHNQALNQCANFLATHLPFAALRDVESTAFGLTRMMEDATGKSAAIVGSHVENLRKGFVMSEESITDEKNNFTHFLLIKKGESALPSHSERIYFSAVCPHTPGSLVELLSIIAKHGVNMTKIESRPVKNKVGDYRFFIEADCDVALKTTKAMLQEIRINTLECKLL